MDITGNNKWNFLMVFVCLLSEELTINPAKCTLT